MSRESRPQPVPSWPTVIATTLRLWLQRHVISPRPNRPRQTRAAVDPAPVKSASASPPNAGSATLAAGASRRQAAGWVAAQVSHSAIVACDPLMCTELHQRGFPAADLSLVSTSAGDPLGSGIVVSTIAVRSQLGSRLATVYAPVVIASFGTGADLVQVRVTALGSAAAYLAAVRADVRARKLAGTERIVSISDAGPDAASGVPLRQLTLAAPTAAFLGRLLAFLRAQRPPLLPLVSLRHHDRATEVQIKFPAPSPTGLLSAGASP